MHFASEQRRRRRRRRWWWLLRLRKAKGEFHRKYAELALQLGGFKAEAAEHMDLA